MLGRTPASQLWWEKNAVTVTWARKAPCTTNVFNPLLDAAQPQDPGNHAGAQAGCSRTPRNSKTVVKMTHLTARFMLLWPHPPRLGSTLSALFRKIEVLLFHSSDSLTNQVCTGFPKLRFLYEQSEIQSAGARRHYTRAESV